MAEIEVCFAPRKLLFAIFVSLLCFPSDVHPYREWSADNFPNPSKDVHSCGRRGVASWVCDPDGLLSFEKANRLEEIIFALSKETKSGCSSDSEKPGFQLALALMKNMNIYPSDSKEEAVKAMAEKLHNEWGVGHRGCDDGALLLLSTEYRQMYISTGKTAMKLLTDNQIKIIMDEMKPELRNKNYDRAVEVAVDRMREVFSGKMLTSSTFSFVSIIFMAVFFGIMFTMLVFAFKRESKYEICKAKLEQIEEERNRAKVSKSYESQSCPICLENFVTADPPLKIRLLLCGHKYCDPCLVKWLEENATCPICRQAVTPTEDGNTPTQRGSYDFRPDLQFRLLSLNRMYPDFITMQMINRWSSQQYRGSFASDSTFVRACPSARIGRLGSGGGFGGGGCRGGGGRGGSW